jgi:hypothetical protein
LIQEEIKRRLNSEFWRVLRKRLYLKAYKPSIVQAVERWIASTTLSVNV